eukprot:jgi/Picre1/34105/NNA_001580.t1
MLYRRNGDCSVLILLSWVCVVHLHGYVNARRSFEPSHTSNVVKEWMPVGDGQPGQDMNDGNWFNASILQADDGQDVCPKITLQEKSLLLRWRNIPTFVVFSGQFYQRHWENGNIRAYNGVPYIHLYPKVVVGSLSCGEVMNCDVDIVDSFGGRIGDDPKVVTRLATGGCDYDYRNFVQWGYKQKGLGFTCDEGSVYFTLMCEECQEDTFPWELARNLSGPELEASAGSTSTSFNYIMVITAVSVVGFAVLASLMAVLVRSRRRTAIDMRVAEMVSRNGRNGRGSDSFKPPELFVVGEDTHLPVDAEYSGPIVVLNAVGSNEEDSKQENSLGSANTSWSLPQIAVLDAMSGDEEATEEQTDDKEHLGSSSSTSNTNNHDGEQQQRGSDDNV